MKTNLRLLLLVPFLIFSFANNDTKEKSTIVLVEELPCILDEQKVLDKEVTSRVETDKDFSKKLLESDSICKENQSSSNTAPTSSLASDVQGYISGSSSNQSPSNQSPQNVTSANQSTNPNENISQQVDNNSKTNKDPKVERCAQNLNLNSEVEKNLIDEISKTSDENIKKALLEELAKRSSKSVDVIENQCFN
tara:strand:- start:1402 stop:1983 length:582 start_codon:yes stop_codon:yes gene_type:complete